MVSGGPVQELRRWLSLGKSLAASARIAEMDEKTARRYRTIDSLRDVSGARDSADAAVNGHRTPARGNPRVQC